MHTKLFEYLTGRGSGLIFQSFLADVILALVTIHVIKKVILPLVKSYKKCRKQDEVAKGTPRHWFYGHLKAFGETSQKRLESTAKRTKTFPTMFNFWRGPVMSVTQFYHHDLAQSFFSSGAPKDEVTYGFLRPWIGDGLLTSKGEKWKRNRRLLTPAFHYNILKSYVEVSNSTARVLTSKWKEKTEQPLNISEDISMMTLDTMILCAMSTKTDCQLVGGQHPYITAVKDLTRNLMLRLRTPIYFIDWIFRLSSLGRKFYKTLEILHKHTEEIIAERKEIIRQRSITENENKNKNGKNMLDFLDILLQTRDEDGKGLTDQEIRDEVDTFMFEGHDTTSSGIQWALYNLAKYPQYQEKCREEVQSVVGDKENVTWDDLGALGYLTMFIKESLRLYPPVFTIERHLEKPLKLCSQLNDPQENVLPAGSSVSVLIYAMHRNKLIWKDPDEFIPERFNKENSSKRHPHSYVPFSAGSRNCIGQNFAMNEMKIVLAQILKSFRLYLDNETPEPEVEVRLIIQSKDGIFIKLKSL